MTTSPTVEKQHKEYKTAPKVFPTLPLALFPSNIYRISVVKNLSPISQERSVFIINDLEKIRKTWKWNFDFNSQ